MASEHIKRNTFYSFLFSQADAESVQAACLHLQLDLNCRRLFGSLLSGLAIFRQSQASWSNAMLVKIDYFAPSRNLGPVTYDDHPFTPAIELSEAQEVLSFLDALVKEHKNTEQRQDKTNKPDSENIAMKLLQLAAENPFVPVARLFEKLGKIRFQTQIEIRHLLENRRLAEFEETRIGSSTMLLMELTDDGFNALGFPVPSENKGRGGITHRHLVQWIKQHFEAIGCKAYIEWLIPHTTHPVDVAVESANGWRYFEICVTAFDNVLSHITVCFENQNLIESLTFVTGTKSKSRELRKLVESDPTFLLYADKIKFEAIESYMKRS